MESVIFDGKEYTKASVLAKKFRYTQDYLGQLCRAKKVDARLVGRAWYINLDSLNNHRDARYKATTEVAEIYPKKAINNYLSRIDVEPILKQKTVKIFKNTDGVLSELSVKYESDDYALIPRVQKEAVSTTLAVMPAEAERVRVRKTNADEINFEPELLPEVYLKGTLTVAGLPEIMEERKAPTEEKTPIESKPVEAPRKTPKIVTIKRFRQRIAAAQTLHSKPSVDAIRTLESKTPVEVAVIKKIEPVPVRPLEDRKSIKFTPAVVSQKTNINTQLAIRNPGYLVPVALAVMAIVFSTLLASTSAEVFVSGSSYDTRLVVQMANLVSYYDRLSW